MNSSVCAVLLPDMFCIWRDVDVSNAIVYKTARCAKQQCLQNTQEAMVAKHLPKYNMIDENISKVRIKILQWQWLTYMYRLGF